MTKDMTTGNPVKLILLFSIPLLVGNVFQQFYSMADTIIVGRFLGVKSLAAVGSTGSLTFLVMGFVMGLSSGFSVLISQRFGANDEEGVKYATGNAVMLSVIATIIITFISIMAAKPLLMLIKTPRDIMNDAYSYLIVIFTGISATFFYNTMSTILRALGDSKTPLYFLIIACILNVVLDLVFIIIFKMGVSSAALATIISQGVSGLLCLIYTSKKFPILKLSKRHLKLDKEICKRHLSIAIPMSLQFSITAIGTIILQGAINSFGSSVVAANTAAIKVEQFAMQPSVTFGVTMATYVAQNLGAGNIDRIKDGVRKCTMINILIGIVAGIILTIFGESIVRLFVSGSDPKVLSYAKQYLSIEAFFFIPLSLIFIYRNALQGMGHTFVPMMAGVCELVARSIVAFTLPSVIGYLAICIAGPIAWIAAIIPLLIDYKKKVKYLSNEIECNTVVNN
ncbi:MAG: MATE family efflux transporter [Peptostreptococcaceae bacterium]